MASENSKSISAANTGAKAAGNNPLDVAASLHAAKSNAPSPVVVAATGKPPALFGGNRGGGKKRLDGLPAGSPEAIAADKEKERIRSAARRQQKVAALPPTLPSAAAPSANPAAPVDQAASPVSGVAPDLALAPGVAPMFVPWTQRLLDKPAKLIAKIADRMRGYVRAKQVKKLQLSTAVEKEVLERLKWREEVQNDFALALSECATVELNKHRIGGSENAHWINLAMCCGELVALEMGNSELIEKLILEDRSKTKAESATDAAMATVKN